jgi:hypothetical protein
MNLSEKLAKKNLSLFSFKETQHRASNTVDKYKENLDNKIKNNNLSRKDYEMFYEVLAQDVLFLLNYSEDEIQAKAKILCYISAISHKIGKTRTNEELSFLGLKIDTDSYPFLSSSARGFLTSCTMDEFKKISPYDIESHIIIKRTMSVAFTPSKELEKEINTKTALSIFYEKKHLENQFNKDNDSVKKMKL